MRFGRLLWLEASAAAEAKIAADIDTAADITAPPVRKGRLAAFIVALPTLPHSVALGRLVSFQLLACFQIPTPGLIACLRLAALQSVNLARDLFPDLRAKFGALSIVLAHHDRPARLR